MDRKERMSRIIGNVYNWELDSLIEYVVQVEIARLSCMTNEELKEEYDYIFDDTLNDALLSHIEESNND